MDPPFSATRVAVCAEPANERSAFATARSRCTLRAVRETFVAPWMSTAGATRDRLRLKTTTRESCRSRDQRDRAHPVPGKENFRTGRAAARESDPRGPTMGEG